MNHLKILKSMLAGGCSLVLISGCSFSDPAPKAKHKFASEIILSEKEAGGTVDDEWCNIPAVEGTYKMRDLDDCYTDDYDLIMFNNVPSGLTVEIWDQRNCEEGTDWDWAVAVTTVKQPTTTGTGAYLDDWIDFNTIWNAPDNTVIKPGVMKQWKKLQPGDKDPPEMGNDTSCVRIIRN